MEKRNDPEHPYCTNWPVNERKELNRVMDRIQLKQFIHPHWGTIVGKESDIRIAVLKEELELWEKRLSDNPDDIPYLGYIKQLLEGRMVELENARMVD